MYYIYIHTRERFSSPPSPQSVTIRILYPHRSSPPTPLSRYPPPLFPFTTYTKSAADPTKSSSRRFGVLVSSLHHHSTVLSIDATVFLLFRLCPSSPLAADKSPVDCNTAQPGFVCAPLLRSATHPNLTHLTACQPHRPYPPTYIYIYTHTHTHIYTYIRTYIYIVRV